MKDFQMTREMLEKAKTAASAEELMAFAKAHDVTLEAQEAAELFASLHQQTTGEIDDAELDAVAGGSWERRKIPGSQQTSC